ncbi:phosphomannomutase [Marinomonas agarivorans]|nr:phosphomannomutase [Marinomonas agarivorans]
MISVQTLSDAQGVAFGTSGVRGLVEKLTPELCYAYTLAFINGVFVGKEGTKKIAIAMDLRPSSPDIVKACCMAIENAGYEVVFCGAIPTPALAYYSMTQAIPCIMVTGSHIPFDRNGIKFYRPDGEISKSDEASILSQLVALPAGLPSRLTHYRLPTQNTAAEKLFVARYQDLFADTPNVLKGMKVGFYQHSSVARDLLTRLLQELGAEVIALDRTETFVPIDTEAVAQEDIDKARVWSKQGYDALISTDGDGDRPLIADEHGTWLRGDVVGILCAEYLQATHVVTPINSNTALEYTNIEVSLRTRIGSPYVIAGMEQLLKARQTQTELRLVGYEANGGFLVGTDITVQKQTLRALPTRDSILPIVLLLVQSRVQGKPLSQLANHLPKRFTASDRIKNIPTTVSQTLLSTLMASKEQQEQLLAKITSNKETLHIIDFNQVDGVRMTLNNGDIVHLRPSGNAPELRCYAEADSYDRAHKIVRSILVLVKQRIED